MVLILWWRQKSQRKTELILRETQMPDVRQIS